MPLVAWHADGRTLAALAMDAFLLARYCSPGHSPASGRAWERAVSQLLWRPGFTRRQHAGVLGLFGRGSQSGARHEIDGAGQGPEIGAWIESKARTTLNKSDVAVFHLKCFDLYRAAASEYPEQTAQAKWWPLLVSSEPTGEAVRRICCDLGVVVCDPQRLPRIHRSKLDGAGCRAAGEFGGCAGARRAVPRADRSEEPSLSAARGR